MRRRSRYALPALVALVVGAAALFAPVWSRLDYARLPSRASWQLPDRVIEVLELGEGDRVADLGAGRGYFTFRLADAVGAEGRVYAVDITEEIVRELREEAASRGYDNVEVVLAEPDDPRLPDGGVDVVFSCNVYHHIEDRVAYFDELRRDLTADGRVVVVDLRGQLPYRWLSPPGHEMSLDEILREMDAANYEMVESFDFLPLQNLVVFSPHP